MICNENEMRGWMNECWVRWECDGALLRSSPVYGTQCIKCSDCTDLMFYEIPAESSAIGRNAKVNEVVHVIVAHPVILGRRLCGGCVRWVGGLDCGCGCIRRGLVLLYCSRLYLWISI
jgi:hypothetical protein